MNFIYLNWTSILVPFIAGIFNFRYFDKNLKIIFSFVCYGTANEVFTRLLFWLADVKNAMPLLHLYGAISLGLLFAFYFYVLKSLIDKRIYLILTFVFFIYWVVNSLFIQSIFEYPSLPSSLGDILIILLSIMYFYKVMMEAKIVKLADEPSIWINTAILIYYTGNLFFYILFNNILEVSREFSKITVYYYSALMALFYILIAVGFLKARKRKPVSK
ncbi:hypothetical protein GM418_04100 [Maribellus comscasis]|uniref:Uncharacterized protein n=1 Tax=Maribellus comscasis TaxID=2681766 RepID=A0A6I6JJ30_9BACT|nr:hypothetical protein [Maribellus comscasis]QGY42865.1 hypothetical protein GM418_04100 [Maribellus comscasis]